jgi:glycosyltransferase involved in cell wall biosynthesis
MRALVVILAYNEEHSIQEVIQRVRDSADVEILVVDDGSQDRTREKAVGAGVRCISLPINTGIGVAEQVGFMVAAEEGHDCLIRIDGDGQHDPQHLHLFLETLSQNGDDLVIGSRYVNGYKLDHSQMRRLGTRFLSWLVRCTSGVKVTDATSGYRGYSRHALEVFAEDYPDDFPEVEALMICHQRQLKVSEIFINAIQRESGDSVIRPTVATYYMSKVTLSILMNKLREFMGGET